MTRLHKIIVFVFFFIFFFAFCCISLWRYNIGQVFYYDFGHFARIIWLISKSLPPIINHKVLGEIHFFGDHFSPSIYLLSPLFWFTNKLQILLIEQAFATVIAGFLIFMLAKKEKLNIFVALAITSIFLLFAGVENPLVTDWHSESTAVVFLLLFIYLFFYTKHTLLGFFCGLIFIGFKDNNALSLIFILIPYFFIRKQMRKQIFFIGIFALLWFLFVGYVLTPFISRQPYLYSPVLPKNPIEYITNFFNLEIKRTLLFNTFASFGFLPIFSGVFILPIIAELSIRLVPTYIHSQDFTLGMHYNVFLGAFLAIASIKTISSIKLSTYKMSIYIQIAVVSIAFIISLFIAKKITHSPILLTLNPVFWNEWYKKAELFNELKLIPSNGTVMSQNNILPHLVKRKEKIYLLSIHYEKYRPDTIVFDLSPGQNINNYYSGEIRDIEQVLHLKNLLVADKKYRRLPTKFKDFYLFQKI